MLSRLLALAICPAVLLATGCATVATSPQALARMDAAQRQVVGQTAAFEFSKQLQVRLPAKLAVTDATCDTWYDTDARRLVQAVNGLAKDTDTYVDVVSVAASTDAGTPELEALREQAAMHQADLQLVVTRREEVRSGSNALAVLKLLLVPMLFVPTEDDDVELTVRAIVRDVRNGVIYTTFDDHRTTNVVSSMAGQSAAVRKASDDLYAAAVEDLREALARKLPALERASAGTR